MKTKHNVRFLALLLIVGLFVGLPSGAAFLFAAAPEANSGLTSSALYDVWGSSASDVFAVGQNGTILHYDGTAWAEMNSGVVNHLYGVWGSGDSNVFAVGQGGILLRYSGAAWTTMDSPTTQTLYGVWGSSASDILAVGDGGTILRYNGLSWASMSSGVSAGLWDVWGSGASDVFAVGFSGTVLRYNGSTWSAMSGGSDVWLRSVWGSSASNVFAVGINGTILRFNGSSWSAMNSGSTESLWGVWGSGPGDVLAVGEYGTLLHYDGSTWTTMGSSTSVSLYGVWSGVPGDVVIVGGGGTLLRYIQAVITPELGGALVYAGMPDTAVSIAVPAGSVTETITLAYVPVAGVMAAPGFSFAGLAFDLNAYRGGLLPDFRFLKPVTVTITYPDSMVAGVDPEGLMLMFWAESSGAWRDVIETCTSPSAYVREPQDNRLTVPICRTGFMALFKPQYQVYLPLVLRNR